MKGREISQGLSIERVIEREREGKVNVLEARQEGPVVFPLLSSS